MKPRLNKSAGRERYDTLALCHADHPPAASARDVQAKSLKPRRRTVVTSEAPGVSRQWLQPFAQPRNAAGGFELQPHGQAGDCIGLAGAAVRAQHETRAVGHDP